MDEARVITITPWLTFEDPNLESWYWYYVLRNTHLRSDVIWAVLNLLAGCLAVLKLANAGNATAWVLLLCTTNAALAAAQALFIWLHPETYLRWRIPVIATCRVLRILQAVHLSAGLTTAGPLPWLTTSYRLFLVSPAASCLVLALAFPLPFSFHVPFQLITSALAFTSAPSICHPSASPPSHPALLSHYQAIDALITTLSRYVLKLVPTLVPETPADPCCPAWAFTTLLQAFLLPTLLLYALEARRRACFMAAMTQQEGFRVQGLRYTLSSMCVSLALLILSMLPIIWESTLVLYTRVMPVEGGQGLHLDWLALVATALVVEAAVKVWCCACAGYLVDACLRLLLRGRR